MGSRVSNFSTKLLCLSPFRTIVTILEKDVRGLSRRFHESVVDQGRHYLGMGASTWCREDVPQFRRLHTPEQTGCTRHEEILSAKVLIRLWKQSPLDWVYSTVVIVWSNTTHHIFPFRTSFHLDTSNRFETYFLFTALPGTEGHLIFLMNWSILKDAHWETVLLSRCLIWTWKLTKLLTCTNRNVAEMLSGYHSREGCFKIDITKDSWIFPTSAFPTTWNTSWSVTQRLCRGIKETM